MSSCIETKSNVTSGGRWQVTLNINKPDDFIFDNAENAMSVNPMDVEEINNALSQGKIQQSGVFFHLEELQQPPITIELDFGLNKIPDQPDILWVRGPR